MVIVTSGKDVKGKPCQFYLDGKIKKALDGAIQRNKREWDYVAIVAGIPGAGKSTFTRTVGRYLCPWFNHKYYAFRWSGGPDGFYEITTKCKPYSTVVLDESFQSMAATRTTSKEFAAIVNHLQIIRQKHLYIFLCLPNFFDLAKGIAVFRSSHLFVTYADEFGRRGRVMAFDRSRKRRLYVEGGKYMNYDAVRANFTGSFTVAPHIFPVEEYEKRKREHLMKEQQNILASKGKRVDPIFVPQRNTLIYTLANDKNMKHADIGRLLGLSRQAITEIVTDIEKNKSEVMKILQEAGKKREKRGQMPSLFTEIQLKSAVR